MLEKKSEEQTMVENNEIGNKVLKDYLILNSYEYLSSVTKPTMQANSFDLNIALINMVQ